MTISDDLWRSYVATLSERVGLGQQSLLKIDTGLSAADWEGLDTTGLPPPPANLGQPIAQGIYDWADPMPRWAPASYEAGTSFFDMYTAFLHSLKPSPGATAALQRAGGYRMQGAGPGTAGPFPAYTIFPSLNSWYIAALQSLVQAPPALDFTVTAGSTSPAPRAALTAAFAASTEATSTQPEPGEGGVGLPFLTFQGGRRLARHARPASGSSAAAVADPGPEGLSLRYTAQSLASFTVSPGGWYDSSMLAIYADQIDPASPLAGKPLFGPLGLLNLTAARIIVALRRSVTITGPASQIARISAAHAKGGTGTSVIGGFAFDSGGSTARTSGGSDVFVLKDNTNTPYVIGVGIKVLGS